MKKKTIAGITASICVIAILLSSLLMQGSPSYAAYVRSLPTGNTELAPGSPPTDIPGVIITGDYIRIGVNNGGTFGVGKKDVDPGTGFQYPIGPAFESLAIWWWGEGYVFAYKTEVEPNVWKDNVAYWQPGYGWPPPAACNIKPIELRKIVDDSNFAHYLVLVNTADGVLKFRFHFMFAKHMKYVTLFTEITNTVKIKDLVYKRFVDWDVHQATVNDWSTDAHSVYAYYFNEELKTAYLLTASGEVVANYNKYKPYAEVYGWDDYTVRPPRETVQSHATPIPYFDGAGMITFDLGNGLPRYAGVTLQTTMYYQASEAYSPLT